MNHGRNFDMDRGTAMWPEQIPTEWRRRMQYAAPSLRDTLPEPYRSADLGRLLVEPLRRQCEISPEESFVQPPGFCDDPLHERRDDNDHKDSGDGSDSALLKKYAGRALIVTEAGCAIHCRFCFRRHRCVSSQRPFSERFADAMAVIGRDPDCHEVILSGGDPLMESDSTFAAQVAQIATIPSVRRIRIHTRIPIVWPERVTDEFCGILRGIRSQAGAVSVGSASATVFIVVHVNHPAELAPVFGDGPAKALGRLTDAGIPVLSQTTLLRGVNDSAGTLATLLEMLIDHRVIPYYLHQLDCVAGAAHFETPVAEGRRIMKQLRYRLPGYAIPRYVRELPGEPCKTPLDGPGVDV